MPVNNDFIAGTYSITVAAQDVGVTLNGVRLRWSTDDEPITVDLFGSQPIDRIFRGISEMSLLFDIIEMTATHRVALLRYFASGQLLEQAGTLLHAQTRTKPLILTALTGPGVAKAGFEKYGFHVYPLGDIEQVFNSQQLQAYNMSFQVFPTLFGGAIPVGIAGGPPPIVSQSSWFYAE